MQRYILEEWEEDYQAGRLARREFLRRVTLMAGVSLAGPLLESLGIRALQSEIVEAASGVALTAAGATGATVPPDDPAREARMITFPMGSTQVIAYVAQPKGTGPFPGVLVIHENRGLLEHFKDVATMNAAVRHLQGLPAVRRDRVGAMGFCFGGGMTWRLATANPDLRAAVPFYGPNPPLADIPRIKAAVLAIYGALDTRINAGIPAIRGALQNARIVHEIVIYPDADHAFFNDTGARYKPEAARDAWAKTLAWFEKYLKGA
ncbi:MAG: dienelactone hydrolase family protein [Armatimonadetes bacterium]|nr:dienelactone hydrolase family protein [Armatimonadota bacterium]